MVDSLLHLSDPVLFLTLYFWGMPAQSSLCKSKFVLSMLQRAVSQPAPVQEPYNCVALHLHGQALCQEDGPMTGPH